MKKKLFILIPVFILIVISLLNMFVLKDSGYENYLLKQSIWFILGFIVLIIFYLLKPSFFFRISPYLYWANILLLVLVLFFGVNINGSKAWFRLPFFSFQPSELMKFSLTLYLSNILEKEKNSCTRDEFRVVLKALFYTIIPSLLVFLEPDTGAIIIYFVILIGMIITYHIHARWYVFLGIIVAILGGIFFFLYYFKQDLLIKLIGTSFFYRVDRLLSFIREDSFQLDRALISIGSAIMFANSNGVYIPEAPTDFIVAFSIYHLGIISFIFISLSFIVLDCYFIIMIHKLKIKRDKLFVSGFIFMFLFAQIQNIGMNLGLLPIIGLPLPFVSYGGTNIIVYFMFLGIILFLKNKKKY